MADRHARPAGFKVGECWGNIFKYPENHSAATEAAAYVARHGSKNGRPMIMRQMVKLREIEIRPERFAKAMERIERLQDYGCKIELCVDLFNSADHRRDYHQRIEWPRQLSIKEHVRDLVRDIEPEELECMNEFWYTRGNQDIRMTQYRDEVVFPMSEGCIMANVRRVPQLNASIQLDPQDRAGDLWVWDIDHPGDDCCEVYHFNILSNRDGNTPITPEGLRTKLQSQAYCSGGRNKAVGWRCKMKLNETSPVGDRVDLNSRLGADMMEVLIDHQMSYNMPVTMLSMGGDRPLDAPPGDWGMRTNFIGDDGEVSRGIERLLDLVGADQYEGPVDPPPPDTGGMGEIIKAERDLRVTKKNWGTGVGLRHAHRTIAHIQNAISQRD